MGTSAGPYFPSSPGCLVEGAPLVLGAPGKPHHLLGHGGRRGRCGLDLLSSHTSWSPGPCQRVNRTPAFNACEIKSQRPRRLARSEHGVGGQVQGTGRAKGHSGLCLRLWTQLPGSRWGLVVAHRPRMPGGAGPQAPSCPLGRSPPLTLKAPPALVLQASRGVSPRSGPQDPPPESALLVCRAGLLPLSPQPSTVCGAWGL